MKLRKDNEEMLPEVIFYVAASLDGFIAGPNHELDWLNSVDDATEDYGYGEMYRSVDGLIMGRGTFDLIRKFSPWPYPDKTCYVMSATTPKSIQENIIFTSNSPGDFLKNSADTGHTCLWLVGGGELAGSFCRENFITKYIISYVPIILGNGIPVIQGLDAPRNLVTVESNTYPTGMVQVTLEPEAK